MDLTENRRRELLHEKIMSEPTITVNTEVYHISALHEHPEYIVFYAVCVKHGALGAEARLARHCWEEIESSLGMAFAYHTILCQLEDGVKHSGGAVAYYD